MPTNSALDHLAEVRRIEAKYIAEVNRLRTMPSSEDWKPLWTAEQKAQTATKIREALEELFTSEGN